jgi:2-keto-4-pentenoate hydratase/2-oxohepta-3-ene-1,7-dioic acid hydratase in catechol pathway
MSNESVRAEWQSRFGRSEPRIVCVGLNYQAHAMEGGRDDLPTSPLLFAKFANTLCGDGDPIVVTEVMGHVDSEAELAIVIGETVKDVSEADALSVVAGYTVANDVSARDEQFGDKQFFRGKGHDTFCPIGAIVELDDPSDLRVIQRLNGEVLQDSRTSFLIFGVPYLISYISRQLTLEPGDLILTGTPDGVGVFREPKLSMKAGDVVECEVEGIGIVRNEVRAA